MVIFEDKKKILYATDLYSGIVMSIDIEKNVIINSIEINAPTFISLLSHSIIVLTSNDVVSVINIQTFKPRFKFEIDRSVSLNSLCTIKEHNAVFLTCHEVLADDVKSKHTYMCVIKIEAYKSMCTRKIYMDCSPNSLDLFLVKVDHIQSFGRRILTAIVTNVLTIFVTFVQTFICLAKK